MRIAGRHPGLRLITAATLFLLPLLLPGRVEAQLPAPRELASEAARLLQELAQLRGLPTAGPPPRVAVRSREERRRFIMGELRRKFSPARLEAERRGLIAWGLIPRDFDLGGFLTDLVLEQAAAYYDPIGKVMVLANWLSPEAQREALAHELVHVLQDRQMDLDRFLHPTPGKGDEVLARQALIEGEAVALTLDWALRRHGQDLGKLPDVIALQKAIVTSSTGPVLGRAPRFLRTALTFPYAQGLGFVHQFRRRHGWAELSRLYHDPPRSSAQILHPERYFDRRQDPLPVSLPDLAPALGPDPRRLLDDEVGEFAFTEILREFLGEAETAVGWRGDRYAVWDDARGTPVLVVLSVWEDEAAATVFADAYARLVVKKHGLGAPIERGPAVTTWQAAAEGFLVERRGREILLLERAPAPALDRIRGIVWASRPNSRWLRSVSAPRPG
ncbi:MAG: hypothetical protein ACRELA_25410 [Candidatus Rokuibacteriota bacterium]